MAGQRVNVHIPPCPVVLDSVRLRDIQLPLPIAPDSWHRPNKSQPCTASLKLSYSSAIAAAAADEVSLSLDYGKLYRRLQEDVSHIGKPRAPPVRMVSVDGTQQASQAGKEPGQDVRLTAGVVADCALGLLDETAAGVRRMSHVHLNARRSSASAFANYQVQAQAQARAAIASSEASSSPIDGEFGQCEVRLHFPKALLRAEEGLHYRSVTVWGYRSGNGGGGVVVDEAGRCPVVLEEEFTIDGIRCYCILGINSHERVEKQAVIISLEFKGPGQCSWGSTVVDTYQEMTRVVAERVESTSFQTVEALASFVARIVTGEFANEGVTVKVEKPSALAFVGRSGVELTRSQAFFQG